jgi:hypothetical protein
MSSIPHGVPQSNFSRRKITLRYAADTFFPSVDQARWARSARESQSWARSALPRLAIHARRFAKSRHNTYGTSARTRAL